MNNNPTDTRFEGGGTPIGQVIGGGQAAPPGPPSHGPPAPQQHPVYQPPQQMEYYDHGPPGPAYYEPIPGPPAPSPPYHRSPSLTLPISSSAPPHWFTTTVGVKWQYLVVVVLLFLIFSNASVYNFEKQFIPMALRASTTTNSGPPLVLVVFNAMIVGALFLVCVKFV